MPSSTFPITDTVIMGLQPKHALNCLICGADLPRDPEFQRLHMEKVHGMEC